MAQSTYKKMLKQAGFKPGNWSWDLQLSDEMKPKWFQFRRQIARLLVWFAKKIYPESPEIWAFYSKIAVDAAICGEAIVRVDPTDLYKGNEG